MALFDVAVHPAGEQFDYWHDVICEAFVPLAPTQLRSAPTFVGQVETRPLSQIVRARVTSEAQRASHGRREVARTDGEFVFVNLQTAGTCAVEQGGRRSLIRPGQFTVFDTTEPYDTSFDRSWGMVSYRIPREMLGGRLDAVRALTGSCWGTDGVGSVVTAVMSSMWDLESPGGPAGAEVEHVLVSALAAAAAERVGAPTDRREELATQARREIEAGMFDPSLSVEVVSRRLGVSSRTLHAAVSASGETFAAMVRRRRLEHAARLLADSRSRATITDIAASVCFDGPASFSRAFRREFGRTPSDVRRSGQVPAPSAQLSRRN
jgi:AraC family transcriptional regulator, positive regulator of tynA and feaB